MGGVPPAPPAPHRFKNSARNLSGVAINPETGLPDQAYEDSLVNSTRKPLTNQPRHAPLSVASLRNVQAGGGLGTTKKRGGAGANPTLLGDASTTGSLLS